MTLISSQAHQAQGKPLIARIASINSFRLIMEAHEFFSKRVRFGRWRAIEVEIENRANDPGAIAVALLLRDSTQPDKSAVYLGQKPIASTGAENSRVKSEPVGETLRFEIPPTASIHKFDEITVMMLPDAGHQRVGPQFAIEQFQLFPR